MHCMTATLLKCWYTTDFFPQNILFMTAIFWNISQKEYTVKSFNSLYYPVETGCKLNKHKTSRRRLGRLMYVQFTSCVYGETSSEAFSQNFWKLSQRCCTVENESCTDVSFQRCDKVALRRYQDVATTLLQCCRNSKHWISRLFYYGLF